MRSYKFSARCKIVSPRALWRGVGAKGVWGAQSSGASIVLDNRDRGYLFGRLKPNNV
jgi:hypothetical protein